MRIDLNLAVHIMQCEKKNKKSSNFREISLQLHKFILTEFCDALSQCGIDHPKK